MVPQKFVWAGQNALKNVRLSILTQGWICRPREMADANEAQKTAGGDGSDGSTLQCFTTVKLTFFVRELRCLWCSDHWLSDPHKKYDKWTSLFAKTKYGLVLTSRWIADLPDPIPAIKALLIILWPMLIITYVKVICYLLLIYSLANAIAFEPFAFAQLKFNRYRGSHERIGSIGTCAFRCTPSSRERIKSNANKTAELSQRRPRDAPNRWVPWKVLRVRTTHPATFPEICNGLLFRSILRMCVQKLSS